MKSLFASTQPLRHAITSRLPANRAVFRLLIATAIISAFLSMLYIKQPASICNLGSRFCFSSPAQVAPQDKTSGSENSQNEDATAEPEALSTTATDKNVPLPTVEPETDWNKAIATHIDVDPSDLGINTEACYDTFPRILDDVKRPWIHYKEFSIIDDEVNWIDLSEGRMKLSIVDKKILIHEANLPTAKMRADAVATLQSLHDAIASTDEAFNPIDFVMDVKTQVRDVNEPVWAFTRRFQENRTWLMPSSNFLFGFNPDRASHAYRNAVEEAVAASKIVVDPPRAKRTRQFVPQPQLGNIGPTRESFIVSVQRYEQSTQFENKSKKVVAAWPAGHPPARSPTKALLNDQVFGEEWGYHTDPNDKSSGIEGYGVGVDMEKEPGKALCQHKYIIWDESFGPDFVDGVAICGSVILRTKSEWANLYSRLAEADGGFDRGSRKPYRPFQDPVIGRWKDGQHTGHMKKHNVVFVRDDMQDVKPKIEALETLPNYTKWIAQNQAQTYRERYLTRAATACYWRTLVRAYSDVYASIKYQKVDDLS